MSCRACFFFRSERAHGAKHHEVGRDLAHIGNSLCDLGRYDDACAAFRDAQAIDAAALGAEHVHTATDTASVGVVLATMVTDASRAPAALPCPSPTAIG